MAAPAPAPLFVDDWSIQGTLGEGGFGEVKLLVNRHTGEAVAMKVTNLHNRPEHYADLVRKEICIHRLLRHHNIIRFYGDRADALITYMFMEYAPGGALYDHIDLTGIGAFTTQKYFRELLSGVMYMHSIGVVHRDIKPENLLIDGRRNLKICDFGLATKFRHMGKERIMTTPCGTMQYIAPEVIARRYRGPPVDIWSCGIVFVAMLTGDVPWAEATSDSPEYVNWLSRSNLTCMPWNRMGLMALSLVRNILTPYAQRRYAALTILEHRWMKQTFEPEVLDRSNGANSALSNANSFGGECLDTHDADREVDVVTCSSQPLPHLAEREDSDTAARSSFSQPTNADALLVSPRCRQCDQNAISQNLIRRMTRFFVSTNCEEALEALRNHLEKTGYRLRRNDAMLTITTRDRLQNPLVFKATALTMGGKTLLDFRLSRGCGLAFKRNFTAIKASLSKIVSPEFVACASCNCY